MTGRRKWPVPRFSVPEELGKQCGRKSVRCVGELLAEAYRKTKTPTNRKFALNTTLQYLLTTDLSEPKQTSYTPLPVVRQLPVLDLDPGHQAAELSQRGFRGGHPPLPGALPDSLKPTDIYRPHHTFI